MKHNKPLIFGSQSFQTVDKGILTAPTVKVVARGQRAANKLRNAGIPVAAISPDLSFLIKPEPVELPIKVKRVFTTHFTKYYHMIMAKKFDLEGDIQIIEKMPSFDTIWEPVIHENILKFHGEPAQHFWIIGQAKEVITCRYQIACAAILAGIKPQIYGTGDENYDTKYLDLMDYYGKSPDELQAEALVSCQIAAKAAMGE